MKSYNEALRMCIFFLGKQIDENGMLSIMHPIRISESCNSKKTKLVALLHNLLEKTNCTIDCFDENFFNKEIIDAVSIISRLPLEKDGEYYSRIFKNRLATLVMKLKFKDIIKFRLWNKSSWFMTVKYRSYLIIINKVIHENNFKE